MSQPYLAAPHRDLGELKAGISIKTQRKTSKSPGISGHGSQAGGWSGSDFNPASSQIFLKKGFTDSCGLQYKYY